MSVAFRPIQIATEKGEGQLVFVDEKLVAVLTRLSGLHGDLEGHWFLEVWFGLIDKTHLTFSDIEAARTWIGSKLDA